MQVYLKEENIFPFNQFKTQDECSYCRKTEKYLNLDAIYSGFDIKPIFLVTKLQMSVLSCWLPLSTFTCPEENTGNHFIKVCQSLSQYYLFKKNPVTTHHLHVLF